jgi:hypothetical protein
MSSVNYYIYLTKAGEKAAFKKSFKKDLASQNKISIIRRRCQGETAKPETDNGLSKS